MKMPGNMQAMMQQAQQMQQKMQEEIALIRVEASAGGGMVTVKMDGHKNVTGVKIDPEVAGDVEMLQDLVMAACNEAAKKVDEETQRRRRACWAGWACRRACSRRVDAGFRRAAAAPDRRVPPLARHRAEVRAEARVSRAAHLARRRRAAGRRRCWT